LSNTIVVKTSKKTSSKKKHRPKKNIVQQKTSSKKNIIVTFRTVPQLPQCSTGGPSAVLPRFKPKRVPGRVTLLHTTGTTTAGEFLVRKQRQQGNVFVVNLFEREQRKSKKKPRKSKKKPRKSQEKPSNTKQHQATPSNTEKTQKNTEY
jgi:hypothetical protein